MTQDREHFRLAAEALGKETGLDLLYELHKKGAGTASTLAKDAGVHIATAQKYLAALSTAGILETRTIKGRTREMVEYSLPDARIVLALDLEEKVDNSSHGSALLIDAMLDKVKRIYGETVDPPPSGDPYDLFLVIEDRYGREVAMDVSNGAIAHLEREGEKGLAHLLPVLSHKNNEVIE